MRALLILVLALAVGTTACGGGLSIGEYAEEVEALVSTMNTGLDELDPDAETTQDVEWARSYALDRVGVRSDFLAGLRGLDPPDEVADLHNTAIGIIERLLAAESALADRVMASSSATDLDSIWETPEGIAARTADEKAVELCLAAQGEFDETADRSQLQDVPWIPAEMKAVVVVALRCTADEQ